MRPCHQYVCFKTSEYTRDLDSNLRELVLARPIARTTSVFRINTDAFRVFFWIPFGWGILLDFAVKPPIPSYLSCPNQRTGADELAHLFAYDYAAMRAQMEPIRTELLRRAMHPSIIARVIGWFL